MSSEDDDNAATKATRSTKKRYNLSCDWRDCVFITDSTTSFYKHVYGHLPELGVVTDDFGFESYECLWKDCDHRGSDADEITRHVKFHGYHGILKENGRHYAELKNLPPCTYLEVESNAIPSVSQPFFCKWDSCELELTGIQELIDHVSSAHTRLIDGKRQKTFHCCWDNCKANASRKTKLIEHVRTHTGERSVACPACGNTFSNNTKFSDHRIRQTTNDVMKFQCSYCYVFLPNARLLREHSRQHVHHYKCCFCDMTCHKPSLLMTHIKFRHLPNRPFKCSSCSYTCKTTSDLKKHLEGHTESEDFFTCTEPNCDYKCRSQSKLVRHIYETHSETKKEIDRCRYMCHLCDRKYSRGNKLTKHLYAAHSIRKPQGYSRFIYRQGEDGYYRLQTVRLESVEIENAIDPLLMEGMTKDEEMVDDPDEIETENLQSQTIIDVVNENGEIEVSNVVKLDFSQSLPPDAKIVAIGQ